MSNNTTITNPGSEPSTNPNNNAVFAKFDSYPWNRDRPFLQGLLAMLGPLSANSANSTPSNIQTSLGISRQARIWWYKSRLGIEIDRTAYENYLSAAADPTSSNSTTCPDPALLAQVQEIQQRMAAVAASAKPDLPAWQLQAPKVDPNIKADDGTSNHPAVGGASAGEDAPYPAHFQAIIEAVTLGKPVPGVREIPNTVVRQPGITPVGKMQAPKKPWERNNQQHQEQQQGSSNTATTTELEFPPIQDDVTSTAA